VPSTIVASTSLTLAPKPPRLPISFHCGANASPDADHGQRRRHVGIVAGGTGDAAAARFSVPPSFALMFATFKPTLPVISAVSVL
jgi:hypothetical protein